MLDRKLARSAPQSGAGPEKPRNFGEIVSFDIDVFKSESDDIGQSKK